jgi:hypothetical protein
LFVPDISAWAQDESLAPGVNERFKQQPSLYLQQFDFANRDAPITRRIRRRNFFELPWDLNRASGLPEKNPHE